jgi:diguanylate cyclase (GGDEF)-like protein
MNDKSFNFVLLLSIVLTLVALAGHGLFPLRHLLLLPNPDTTYYLYSDKQPDGTPVGTWLDESARQWRCAYPENNSGAYLSCSFNLVMEVSESRGIDLSDYSWINLSIRYSGSASKMRVYIRNFDPAYSTVSDYNSTKFNAINLHTKDFSQELRIGLNEFVVSDWWVSEYDLPHKLSRPDLSNAVTLGVDFAELPATGFHDITLDKVEFTGEWISREHWYLLIIACWMLGIFIYALSRLIQLNQQTQHDVKVINQLSHSNAQLKLETDKFRRLSTVDPLTQAYNRFGVDQIVTALINDVKDTDNTFALILIDIDHFKRINDNRGHDAGDRVLLKVANIIQRAIRKQDYLGRWGGEEFIVIMPNTRKEFALAMAEKIRILVFDDVFEKNNPVNVTASFGIGDWLNGEDYASTFKRVDNALYSAKSQELLCYGQGFCVVFQ